MKQAKKRPPQPKHKQVKPSKHITKFKAGNKAAEKYSEETAITVFGEMQRILSTDPHTGEKHKNPVRANGIKLISELCLIVDLSTKTFSYLQQKFCKQTKTVKKRFIDANGCLIIEEEQIPNPHFSYTVLDLLAGIKDICECRLIYSGTPMDLHILKKHYGFCTNPNDKTNNKIENNTASNKHYEPVLPTIITVVERL